MAQTRYELADNFAQVKGDHVMTRALIDMPETLHYALKTKLTDDEWKEFTDDDQSNTSPGQRWFAKTFQDFRVTSEV